jgi:hypothetical protein
MSNGDRVATGFRVARLLFPCRPTVPVGIATTRVLLSNTFHGRVNCTSVGRTFFFSLLFHFLHLFRTGYSFIIYYDSYFLFVYFFHARSSPPYRSQRGGASVRARDFFSIFLHTSPFSPVKGGIRRQKTTVTTV